MAVRAPDFPPGLAWFNTPAPLSLRALRGRFVLLDFWTYCCINCLHVLPDLDRLERKWRDELVVIGVHSAKFEHERGAEAVRHAVLRYGITHPVVSDPDFAVWDAWSAKAWPTFFLVDPRGYIVASKSGEGVFAPIDAALERLVPVAEQAGDLVRTPFEPAPEPDTTPASMLRFPGKVSADAAHGRLFVSDSNHHRLLVTDSAGRVLHAVGYGDAGLDDGAFDTVAFRQPQGTCYDPATDRLFVADTGNHALRVVDLGAGTVTTLAGDGRQARYGAREADGTRSPLNSPWDVLLHDGVLYVAMAGPHQLWAFDPATGRGEVWAGTGEENLVDGPRLRALLAQPSGLAAADGWLYFVDSETSSLRRVPLSGGPEGAVETLVGEGLFVFGDVDGSYPEARLQHPLGVSVHGGAVLIADTYNHKIRRYDPATGALTTWLGTGTPGLADGPPGIASFDEPSGLCVLGATLFVADTNNHRLRTADLRTGSVRTLTLAAPVAERAAPEEHAPISLVPGNGELLVEIALPPGFKPNPLDPGALRLTSDDEGIARPDTDRPQTADSPLRLPLTLRDGDTALTLDGAVYFCADGGGTCYLHRIALRIPLTVDADAPAEATVRIAVPPPD
ncbi:MAG: thioredoxin-like domain-containing protein [Rhodothermales bacterium]